MKLIMPPRVVEKVDFLAPKFEKRDREKLLKFVAEKSLPEALGGACAPWPPPNARFAPKM